ncbi:MAG: GTPase Era [Actinomycetota bacterium]
MAESLDPAAAAGREGFHSGFVSIVGRPNVGKSTLLNRLVGEKISIVSAKPQTTRHALRGILTLPEAQIVFVDTPGLHKPRNLLGERLNATVRRTLREVDAVVFVLDASQQIGGGDAFLAHELGGTSTPVIPVINKADLVLPPRLLDQMETAGRLGPFREVLTTSAVRGTGLDDLTRALVGLLPEGPQYYPAGTLTDEPEAVLVAEIVREKALELTREEVPHSVAVVVDEMERREGADLVDVHALIYVERDSQKAILIGRGARMLKEIGTRARREIEALLGSRVFLDLRVRVQAHWQRSEAHLERFGY